MRALYTHHPQILPIMLMVPFIWLINTVPLIHILTPPNRLTRAPQV